MWEVLWPLGLVLLNILIFSLYAGHINRKLEDIRAESGKLRRKDEKILRLYQEIEDMLNSFEAYVNEVHEEMESRRAEVHELSRQATTLYMQVMQPAVFAPRPAPPATEEPEPTPPTKPEREAQSAEPRNENSRLSPRDQTELSRMATKGQKVRFLMQRGFTVDETAKELGIGKGEVLLIVDLDKK